METLKPGTKCMSRDSLFGYNTGPLPIPSCGSEAARLVTVVGKGNFVPIPGYESAQFRHVPMCAACAEFHERGAK